LRVEPLAVEVGLGLVGFVEGSQNSPLLRRIAAIRKQLASELGYVLPAVRVTDNLSLKAREYSILLKGVEVSRYEIPPNSDLVITSGQTAPSLPGIPTKEPAFGLDAMWIPATSSDAARKAGYTVVDAVSVLGTHLAELIRQHLHELFSRQDTKKLLDRVAAENSKLVEDLVPKLLPLSSVQKVIQNLLRERASIRDAVTLLEAISEAATITKNPVLLTEFARQSIRRMIVRPFLNANQELPAYFLDPSIEQRVESAIEHSEHTSHLNLSPQVIRDIVEKIGRKAGRCETATVLLAGAGSRYFVRQVTEGTLRNLQVISHSEIPAGVRVVSLGMIS
jgi:flagellar biosynthesis protein FlhA